MQAIKDMFLSNNGGINITPLVADLTVAREGKTDTDEVSVKVAILLSGKMPEFKSYIAYTKSYNVIYEVEVIGESSLEEAYKLNYLRKWKFDKESDTWNPDKDFQSYKTIEKMDCVRFLSSDEFDKIKDKL